MSQLGSFDDHYSGENVPAGSAAKGNLLGGLNGHIKAVQGESTRGLDRAIVVRGSGLNIASTASRQNRTCVESK